VPRLDPGRDRPRKPKAKPKPSAPPKVSDRHEGAAPSRPPRVSDRHEGGRPSGPPAVSDRLDDPGAHVAPPRRSPDREAPIRVLANLGFMGTIEDFNSRLQTITDAHERTRGFRPSPGLALDVARSPVSDNNLEDLFDAATNRWARGAKSTLEEAATVNREQRDGQHALNSYLGDAETPKDRTGRLFGLLHQIGQEDLEELPEDEAEDAPRPGDQFEDDPAAQQAFQATSMGFAPTFRGSGYGQIDDTADSAFGAVAGFIAELTAIPYGVFEGGKAVGYDSRDVVSELLRRSGVPLARRDITPGRTVAFGKQMGEGLKDQYRNPGENVHWIMLDLLGVVTGGAGFLARTAAVNRASRLAKASEIPVRELETLHGATQQRVLRGQTPMAALSAMIRRPNPGTFTLSKGDLAVEVLLSQNAFVRATQRSVLKTKQRGIDRRHDDPSRGHFGLTHPIGAEWFEKFFSTETKIGRELQAAKRVDYAIKMSAARELRQITGWSWDASHVLAKLYVRAPWAFRDTKVWRRGAPPEAKGGLTRGEQAAIFALSIDDPTPIQTLRKFHEDFLADPPQWADDAILKNHRQRIADLKLAEAALQNPSERFRRALELTRKVIAEQEELKIRELGLSPFTATARVAATGQVIRGEMSVPGLGQPKTDTAFYLPFVPHGKRSKFGRDRGAAPAAQFGDFGVPVPRNLPELTHVFEGRTIRAGNYRVDATNLAADAYGRTVRAVTVKNEYDTLLKASKKTEAEVGTYAVPIRTTAAVPDKLREILETIESGRFSPKEAAALSDEELGLLHKALFPNRAELSRDEVKNVRWVDSRLIDQRHLNVRAGVGPGSKAASWINEPLRAMYLYLRPAYAVNFLGNGAMAVFEQGFYAPGNFAKALAMDRGWLPEPVAFAIDEAIGQGKARSYTADFVATKKLAEAWAHLTDLHWRRSALLHELAKLGYKRPEDIARVMLDSADENLRRHRVEAVRRANKSMVEFDNLTWFERNTLRHIIFVYPWVSRSLVWSLRAIVNHPIKADLLVRMGEEAEQDAEWQEVLSKAPDWFKRSGYFPVSWEGGRPKVVNASSVNTFSILADLDGLARWIAPEGKSVGRNPLHELLGPAARFAADLTSEWGEGPLEAVQTTISDLPQVRALARREPDPEKTEPSERPLMIPGLEAAYGPLLASGLWRRELDREALEADFWKEQTNVARAKHEATIAWKLERAKAKVVGEKMPQAAKAEVKIANDLAVRAAAWEDENGRDLAHSSPEYHKLHIALLEERGRLSEEKADELRRDLKRISKDEEQLEDFGRAIEKAAGLGAYRTWNDRVRVVTSFAELRFEKDLQFLGAAGLANGFYGLIDAPKDVKLAYGRLYLKYQDAERKRRDAAFDEMDTDQQIALAELAQWLEEQDRPVVVDGRTFPSLVRMDWARTLPKQREEHVYRRAVMPWEFLTSFDKQLLGRPEKEGLAAAWREFTEGVVEALEEVPLGKNVRREALEKLKRRYAKELNARYPGFMDDYLFSKRPLHERLEALDVIKRSKYRGDWANLMKDARAASTALRNEDYNHSVIRDAWKQYIGTGREPGPLLKWLRGETETPPTRGFINEIGLFLEQDNNFLLRLIEN
jgi:hypothetical protein